jgi:hypothetical protein
MGQDSHKSQYILLFYRRRAALYCSAFIQFCFHLLIANFGKGGWVVAARMSWVPLVVRKRCRSNMAGCEWGARCKVKINEDEDEGMYYGHHTARRSNEENTTPTRKKRKRKRKGENDIMHF